MGGGKRKFPKRQKFISEEKKLGKFVEEKKAAPKEEDLKSLIEIWQGKTKKEKHHEETSENNS
ncbi:hypothetical protein J4471_03025 [Candidatus Woesearchaeota archaeon]|nr:hypothetical protein [Candidatus Woesearchaeota archaeon]